MGGEGGEHESLEELSGMLESGGGAPAGFCGSGVSFEVGAFFYRKLYLEGMPKCTASLGNQVRLWQKRCGRHCEGPSCWLSDGPVARVVPGTPRAEVFLSSQVGGLRRNRSSRSARRRSRPSAQGLSPHTPPGPRAQWLPPWKPAQAVSALSTARMPLPGARPASPPAPHSLVRPLTVPCPPRRRQGGQG